MQSDYNNYYSAFAEDHRTFGYRSDDEADESAGKIKGRSSLFIAGIAVGVLGYWLIGNIMSFVSVL
ncbi:hypothetical protein FHT78_002463 [Rhizobium sp. BK196]|jgi:hypothetical protein|uniref:Uncharacterized protein n=1 Tax=Rhizobium viscosum TaxID=1673 RepID=A0ABR9IJ38_RHIVS|nr:MULTISPECIES: hypothetical protein [Rhizobium]MBB3310719.1 hypothetical protein [Rhizobium sp. BK196]MBE1503202.1 hypothetical protein [Rhizobium viscosum]